MISFGDFFNSRLMETISPQGQIAQYEKSLESLSKTRKRLAANGMDTKDIDNQMDHIHHALGRRKSGTSHWFGDIVRIDEDPIGGTLMWKLMTRDGLTFHIPVNRATGTVKIPYNWHQVPNEKKPISKWVEYRQEMFGHSMVNLITYTENRTVDIVPVRTQKDKNEYFLVKRRNSGLWSIVGGNINEGELDSPIGAAHRELHKETGAVPLVMKQLPTGWIREVVTNPTMTPSAEYHSWTLPFIAIVNPETTMEPSTDAAGGSWFDVGETPQGFHFAHHKKVLNHAFKFLPTLLKQFGKY